MTFSPLPVDFGAPLSDDVHQCAQIAESRRRGKALCDELRSKPSRDRRRLLISKYLSSPSIRLRYAFEGMAKAGVLEGKNFGDLLQLSNDLNPYASCSEAALVITRTSRGKQRHLLSFGPKARARQLLVRDLILALHPARPDQFAGRGGVSAALKAVNTAISRGFIYGIELDIRDFYPSVELGHLLATLRPVPSHVTEQCIWIGEDVKLVNRDGSPYRATARALNSRSPRGLAQGSAASAIAAETLLATVFDGIPAVVCIVNYADNILVLGVTKEAVAAACDYLAARLARLPCGPLEFKPFGHPEDVRMGLGFLGFEGVYSPNTGQLRWGPGHAALDMIEAVIEATDSTEARLIKAIRRVIAWHGACPDWPDRKLHACTYLAELFARLIPYSGASADQLSESVERLWQISGNPLPVSFAWPPERHA